MKAVAAFSRSAIASVAALLGAACTSVNITGETFQGTWQVTAINGQPTPETHMYRVQFEDGRIGGRFGCNQFGGSYEVRRDRLIVEDVASTLIGCPEPAATHEAQAFIVLGQPMQIAFTSNERMYLSNAAGSLALDPIP